MGHINDMPLFLMHGQTFGDSMRFLGIILALSDKLVLDISFMDFIFLVNLG